MIARRTSSSGSSVPAAEHEAAAWLATVAGELLLDVRRGGLADKAPKAAGDRASHEWLMAELTVRFPDDAVLSEEGKDDPARLDTRRVWIVDPLDGTREFPSRPGSIGLSTSRSPSTGPSWLERWRCPPRARP